MLHASWASQIFSAQHVTFLVNKEALTPDSMVGYVIKCHTVMAHDQPPLDPSDAKHHHYAHVTLAMHGHLFG